MADGRTGDDRRSGGREPLRLAGFMRRNQARIVAEWTAAVSRPPSATEVPRPVLLGPVPDLVSRLADSMEGMADPAGAREGLPDDRALARLDDRFDLEEVVGEYLVLRSTIERLWEEEEPARRSRRDLGALDRAIGEAVSRSIQRHTRTRERALRAFDRISAAALASDDVNSFLPRLLQLLLDTTESVDGAAILLRDRELLRLRATAGLQRGADPDFAVRVGQGFSGTIAASREPLELRHAATDPLVVSDVIRDQGVRALYGVPLLRGDDVIGVAHICSRTAFQFSAEDRTLFRLMADRATAFIVQAEIGSREREARALLDTVLSASPVGIALLDRELRYVRINEALARVNGLPVEDHLGKRPEDILDPEVTGLLTPLLREVMRTGEPRLNLELEAAPPAAPHDVRTWLTSFYPIRSGGGDVIGVGVVTADVTDKSRAVTEAQQRAAELETVLASIPEAVFVGDATGIKRANAAGLEELGVRSVQELAGGVAATAERVRTRDPATGERLRADEEVFARGLRGERSAREVLLRHGRTGEDRVVRSSAAPIVTDGKITGAVVIDVDLTEQKRIERELRDGEERVRLALEATQAGVFEDDLVTGKMNWDARTKALFGFEPGVEVTWERAVEAVHPDDRERVLRALAAARDPERREAYRVEYRLAAPQRWVLAHGRCHFRPDGTPERFIGTLIDITERKLAEQHLERTAAFREQFISILGHDLRNPLTAISVSAQRLFRTENLDEPQSKIVARILNSADKASRMIGDVLDFARGRLGGGLALKRRIVDLHEICEEAIDELAAANPRCRIELEAEGDGRGCWDPDRLAQLVGNLVSNAITHGDAGAPVQVKLGGRGPEVVLEVANRGPPIPPEVLPALFAPFHRAEGSRAGLGLGLYIVKLIVDAHGGRVDVTSKREEGTSFVVTLARDGGEGITPTSTSRRTP